MRKWLELEKLIEQRPCYTRGYIMQLAKPAKFCVTFNRLAKAEIPDADKLWVVTRIGLVFTEKELLLLLNDAWPECFEYTILHYLKLGYTAHAFFEGGVSISSLAHIYNLLSAAAFRRFGKSLGKIEHEEAQ